MTGRVIRVVIGLIPGVLFVTAFIMWRMRAARRRRAAELAVGGAIALIGVCRQV